MKYTKRIIPGVLLIVVLPLFAQTLFTQTLFAQTHRPKLKAQHASRPAVATSAESNRGQHVFEQNCSRCHNAPEGFSSSISGAIAMHMRTRANLSEADYKALRRFLNP